jgi:hypothetical protein
MRKARRTIKMPGTIKIEFPFLMMRWDDGKIDWIELYGEALGEMLW